MAELRAMWRELWFSMAGGKVAEYEKIKAIPVLEFWKLYDLWKQNLQREVEALKAKQRNK